MSDLPTLLVHYALLLLFPPLLLGVINKTKAWFAGRQGPPLLQPYYDLLRLFRKGMVVSRTTTWVFRAGPVVSVSAALLAGSLLPFGAFDAPLRFTGDLVLFAYLFALGRFFTTAAALDTGSAFEGMGAAREVSFACLAEPALFFAFLVLVRFSGSLSLTPMLHATDDRQRSRVARRRRSSSSRSRCSSCCSRSTPHPGGRPQHAPRADHDPRGHGPRPQRSAPRSRSATARR